MLGADSLAMLPGEATRSDPGASGAGGAGYYRSDVTSLSPGAPDLRIESSLVGEFGLYRLVSTSGIAFRRSLAHVRDDRSDMTVFWFVRQGAMVVSSTSGRHISRPGHCAITRSTRPFYMELQPADGAVEAVYCVVPSHRCLGMIGEGLDPGRSFPSTHGDLLLADRVIDLLLEEDGRVAAETAEQLIRALLRGVGRAVSDMAGVAVERGSLPDRRVTDITRYIRQHFANPELSAKKVARSCGISLRYLCHLLQTHDLAFSGLVWSARLDKARELLSDVSMRHYSISEIAYLVGFKSSAHFSRMFKANHEVGPRDFRTLRTAEWSAAA